MDSSSFWSVSDGETAGSPSVWDRNKMYKNGYLYSQDSIGCFTSVFIHPLRPCKDVALLTFAQQETEGWHNGFLLYITQLLAMTHLPSTSHSDVAHEGPWSLCWEPPTGRHWPLLMEVSSDCNIFIKFASIRFLKIFFF